MLDLLSSRKLSCRLPKNKTKLGVEKAKGRKFLYSEKRELIPDSRPHSYHGNQCNLESALEASRKLRKRDNINAVGFASRLIKNNDVQVASLNCAQTDVYSTLERMKNVDPMIDFGYGGGFTDVSQTWKFHPFKTK